MLQSFRYLMWLVLFLLPTYGLIFNLREFVRFSNSSDWIEVGAVVIESEDGRNPAVYQVANEGGVAIRTSKIGFGVCNRPYTSTLIKDQRIMVFQSPDRAGSVRYREYLRENWAFNALFLIWTLLVAIRLCFWKRQRCLIVPNPRAEQGAAGDGDKPPI